MSDEAITPQPGQPLRFIAIVLSLWVGARLVVASPLMGNNEEAFAARLQEGVKGMARDAPQPGPRISTQAEPVWAARIDRAPIVRPRRLWLPSIERAPVVRVAANAPSEGARVAAVEPVTERNTASAPLLSAIPAERGASKPARRWSGGAWTYWRGAGKGGGRGAALSGAGQLGGSQAGMRLERAVGGMDHGLPMLAYGRLTSALKSPRQSEAAIGLAVRPFSGRMPLTIGIERRIALDRGGRNAFALLAAGGLNPTHVAGPLIAEGYAQAGLAGFSRRDGFVDGRVSLGIAPGRS